MAVVGAVVVRLGITWRWCYTELDVEVKGFNIGCSSKHEMPPRSKYQMRSTCPKPQWNRRSLYRSQRSLPQWHLDPDGLQTGLRQLQVAIQHPLREVVDVRLKFQVAPVLEGASELRSSGCAAQVPCSVAYLYPKISNERQTTPTMCMFLQPKGSK